MTDLSDRLRAAHRDLQAGRLPEAEARYRDLAAEHPENASVHYMLGVVARAGDRLGQAIAHLERADTLRPDDPNILLLLGGCHRRAGEKGRAEPFYARVLDLDPQNGEALIGLGTIRFEGGDMAAAADLLARARAAGGDSPALLLKLGIALSRTGKPDRAVPALEAASAHDPRAINPLMALAEAHSTLGDHRRAADLVDKALALAPDNVDARLNAAAVSSAAARYGEAEAHLRFAVRRRPDDPGIRARIGMLYQRQGRMADGLREFDAGRRLDPTGLAARGFLFAAHNVPDLSPAAIAEAHRAWGRAVMKTVPASPRRAVAAHDPDKRLRVGYVSADFRRHSVASFIEPILRHHDAEAVEAEIFSMVRHPDDMTERLRGLCPRWHDILGLGDDACADLVGRQEIDLLVDLAGHTSGSRLGVFARRPAPVQATYLGYPATTGLPAIDYRLTDAIADPPGCDDLCVERLVRLPHCFLCYRPDDDAPAPAPPPADAPAPITFGSFNNIAKLSDPVIAAWARILAAVPDGRLLLKAQGLADGSVRRHLADRLAAAGLPAGRLDIRPPVDSRRGHLETYGRVDVALDTFPYAGTTTTCEALWMGVPVVTLRGVAHAGRVGASLLHAIGLDDRVAATEEDYVAVAVALAGDPVRRRAPRAELRPRMQSSPLCDGAGFTRRLETAYRSMWRDWRPGSGTAPPGG